MSDLPTAPIPTTTAPGAAVEPTGRRFPLVRVLIAVAAVLALGALVLTLVAAVVLPAGDADAARDRYATALAELDAAEAAYQAAADDLADVLADVEAESAAAQAAVDAAAGVLDDALVEEAAALAAVAADAAATTDDPDPLPVVVEIDIDDADLEVILAAIDDLEARTGDASALTAELLAAREGLDVVLRDLRDHLGNLAGSVAGHAAEFEDRASGPRALRDAVTAAAERVAAVAADETAGARVSETIAAYADAVRAYDDRDGRGGRDDDEADD